jgi:hypothetical protein
VSTLQAQMVMSSQPAFLDRIPSGSEIADLTTHS